MAAPQAVETEKVGRTAVSEEQLIQRIGEGEEAAFDQLYDRYFPRVFSFVNKRLRNRADTEETVQEVFINIFSSIGSYRREAPFSAWVLGLTRRTIASRFKKKRHETVPLIEEDADNIDVVIPSLHREPTPLENYECEERLLRLETAAHQHLNEEQRQLFEMHHLHNRSIHEIAIELKKSEDSVKSNLYRARKVLLAR